MNEKIGRYTEDEILEHLTEGEGRGFLGRSMYDAIFDKIHALKTENEQLQQENKILRENAEHNDKVVDKVNWENKHYKHIIDELEKWLEEEIKHYKEHFEFVCKSPSPVPIDDTKIILEKDDLIIQKLEKVLNKLQELKGDNNE